VLVAPPDKDALSEKIDFRKMNLEDGIQFYQVRVIRDNGVELIASLEVDIARYPVRPPRFVLNQADLYDIKLAQLEEHINNNMLQDYSEDEQCVWILVYQLRELMQRWSTDDRATKSSRRAHRGRDRVPIES